MIKAIIIKNLKNDLLSETKIPKNITISKSKITNINIIIKKWILKEFWIIPTLTKPLSKALILLFVKSLILNKKLIK